MLSRKEWYRTVYLRSDAWRAIRLDVALRFKGFCFICNIEDVGNDAHHIWYDDLRFSEPDQFSFLCRRCHTRIHEITKPSRCCHRPQQERAIKEFRKACVQIRTELKLGTNNYVRHIKRPTGGTSCMCCFRECGELHPFDPWKPDAIKSIPEKPLKICKECEEMMRSEMANKQFEKGAHAWKWAKEFFISRRVSFLPLDTMELLDSLKMGSPSYLGDGI